jgi:hypothetical protein
MADDPQRAAAEKQLAADREISDRSRAEYAERMKGRPTPTQHENDLAVLGAPVFEKEDDGSGPDLGVRALESRPAAGYQTRSAQAQPHRGPATPPRSTT